MYVDAFTLFIAMLEGIKVSDHKETLQYIGESLKWFKQLGNTSADLLITLLDDISVQDNDTQTQSFLRMLRKFIKGRQAVTWKHAQLLSPEYPTKVAELKGLYNWIIDKNKAMIAEEKNWSTSQVKLPKKKTKKQPRRYASKKSGSSSSSESSVFTSRYKRKPVNKQASRGTVSAKK